METYLDRMEREEWEKQEQALSALSEQGSSD